MKHTIFILIACACHAMLLAGCGGGGGGSGGGGGGNTAITGSESGVLTDAAVAGVAYTTSSGVTGVTDANGTYNFNPGDTVQFRLGGLVLGSVIATGVVTPIELANGNLNILQNLLVMLQSLDANGNPADGISIPSAAAAAVTPAINLSAPPAMFVDNGALQAAMTAGGIMTPIVSTTDANAHFLAQAMPLLASNIWTLPLASDGTTALLRVEAGGGYLMGETGPAVGNGQPGVEFGTASVPSFDEFGFNVAAMTSVDTSGDWGLSNPQICDRMRPVGAELIFSGSVPANNPNCTTSTTEAAVSKAENNPTGIVGVWAVGSATTLNTQHFVFFSNGIFLMVDPLGDTTTVPTCGPPGVEQGSYTYDSIAGVLRVNSFTDNTNGCAGLSESDAATPTGLSLTISADGSTAAAVDGGSLVTLFRVSK